MKKTIDEIAYDVEYIKGHELQPQWFKIAKIFILLGAIGGYSYLFGWSRTIVFVLIFLLLSTVVHYTYRIKTERYTKSWLDFRVREENGKLITEKIGKYYYSAIILNAIVSIIISQILPL
jgi:Ca2+-dependent lipid-binding protein